ncbi:MAG: ATP-binding protein [Planctomycetota bacterium]
MSSNLTPGLEILDGVPVGVLVIRDDFEIIHWNRCLEEWTQRSRDEILGSDLLELYPRVASKRFRERLRSVFESGLPEVFSSYLHGHLIPITLPGGELQVQHTIVSAFAQRDSRRRHALIAIQDHTEIQRRLTRYKEMRDQALEENRQRREVEAQLAREMARLEMILRAIPEGLLFSSIDRRIQMANPAFTALTGYTIEEALGQPTRLIYATEEDFEKSGRTRFHRSAKEDLRPYEIELRRKDGSAFPSELVGTPVHGPDGKPIGYLKVFRDITERKEIEQARILAIQEAEAAVNAKSQFVATMSHEIRTPINGVMGMLSLLLDTQLSPEQREYVRISHSSAELLLTLLNQILDFSRLEATGLDLEEIEFELDGVVAEACEILSGLAGQKGLVLQEDIDPRCERMALGDPGRLRQILVNLLGNAIKFTPSGKIELIVRPIDRDGHQHRVRFEVRDTGIGIPPERIPELFQAFTQVDSSTSRRFGGTGLGLAISHQLVTAMEGQIGVESTPDEGSTFWFEVDLPAGLDSETAIEVPAGCRVIVLGQDGSHHERLERWLSDWEIPFDHFEEWSEVARSGGDDQRLVILFSHECAPEDGVCQAELLRQAVNPDLTLLAMTSVNEDAHHCQETDAESIFPIRRARLKEQLTELLSKASTLASEARPSDDRSEVRVLVAEDNVVNLKVVSGFLGKLGCEIVVAQNGLEALDLFRRGSFDIVLMDCMMPEMDGLEATRQIRAFEKSKGRRATPIVALTAKAMPGDREACSVVGMNDYLTKPVRKDELSQMIHRWVPGRTGRADHDPDRPSGTSRTPV